LYAPQEGSDELFAQLLSYSSLIIFFGAEFTHTWATRQRRVEPMPHAEAGAAPQKKSEAATEQATRTAGYDLDTT